MYKRGQITLFIILGALILIIVGLFFLIKSYSIEEGADTEAEKVQEGTQISASIKQYIESCIKNTAESSLLFIGKQGGYYDLPTLSDFDLMLPYYFYERKSNFISKEQLEKQIAKYVDQELFFCIQNFVHFEKLGYVIEAGNIKTNVKLFSDKVLFKVNFPVHVTKGSVRKELLLFETKIPSRLNIIYALIEKFMQIQEEDASSICISCLIDSAIEDNLRVSLSSLEDGFVVFTITDEKIKIKNQDYKFEFMNKYDLQPE